MDDDAVQVSEGEQLTVCMFPAGTFQDTTTQDIELPVTYQVKMGRHLITLNDNTALLPAVTSDLELILENGDPLVSNIGPVYMTTVEPGVIPEQQEYAERMDAKCERIFSVHKSVPAKCIVPGCNKSSSNSPDEIFFKFPSEPERCHNWLLACRRYDLANSHFSESSDSAVQHFICSDHFIDSCFTDNTKRMLNKTAVPTLVDPSMFNTKHLDSESECELDDDAVEVINNESGSEKECIDSICRLCGNKEENMVYIYDSTGRELCIADKINYSLPVKVKNTDHLPKQICGTCTVRLDMCFEFTDVCIRTEKMLKMYLRKKKFRSEQLETNRVIIESVNGGEICTKNQEKEHDNTDIYYSCPFCDNGVMHSSDEKQNCNYMTHKKDTVLPEQSYDITEDQENSSNSVWQIDESNDTEIIIHNFDSKNNIIVENDNMIKVFEFHKNVGARICGLCDELLETLENCMDHCKMHSTGSNLICCLCLAESKTEDELCSHIGLHVLSEKKILQVEGLNKVLCSICGKKFNNEHSWQDHVCVSGGGKQFKCVECKKQFATEERLQFHLKFHNGNKSNFCENCNKTFDSESALYYHHKLVHKGVRPYSCHLCEKRFYSNARLLSHLRVHAGERPYTCEICSRGFYDRETLKGHYVTHMSIKPFKCDICNTFVGRKSLLKQHMDVHHSGSHVSKRIPSLIHYFCKICDKLFTSSNDVLSHRTTHWKTKEQSQSVGEVEKWSHVCEYCGHKYDVLHLLSTHRKLEHGNEKPYICSVCNETSHTLYEARQHRKCHTATNDGENGGSLENMAPVFICEECGMQFSGRRKMKNHLKTHKTVKVFNCSSCIKTFPSKRRLLLHERYHLGIKPYACTTCGKTFTQSSAMHTHSLLHTGIKPHKCDFCGKSFRIKADRDNHRRTHTGERPYKCEFCLKTFRTGQVYYQHRLIHTGERRFPCDMCGKAFKRSHTLAVHKRIHTGEKPNMCDICGRGFRQRTDMRKHRKQHEVHFFENYSSELIESCLSEADPCLTESDTCLTEGDTCLTEADTC